MHVLILSRKNATERELAAADDAECWARAMLAADAVVHAASIEWEKVREAEGGFDGAHEWAARTFDVVILIEDSARTIAKGQHGIAIRALERAKRVLTWRGRRALPVTALVVLDDGGKRWKQGFASVEAGDG